jgi:serine/threonine protein phosphatase 1
MMSRTLAIGDIHGCSAALDALLALVRPASADIVVTLGDYVDRGPDSKGVLERLLRLEGIARLVPLIGNHDEMMLEARHGRSVDWQAGYGEATMASYGGTLDQIPQTHWGFLERCRDWYETPTHIFAHGNIDPNVEMQEQLTYTLGWKKLRSDEQPHRSGKTLVCGHASQKDGRPLNLGHAVCIDTYAHGGGWLTCLEPGTGRLWMANQHGETRSGWLTEIAKTVPTAKA